MLVKTLKTDANGLEVAINKIKYENIVQILPEHSYDGTLYIIVYEDKSTTSTIPELTTPQFHTYIRR